MVFSVILAHERIFHCELTSGRDNNCLLYASIRGDQSFLEDVVGPPKAMRLIAPQTTKIFSQGAIALKPYNAHTVAGPHGICIENLRDFREVRACFFDSILKNLDKTTYIQNRDRHVQELSVLQMIRDIMDNSRAEPIHIRRYLSGLKQRDAALDVDFATILSILYNKHIYVLIDAGPKKLVCCQRHVRKYLSTVNQDTFVYYKDFHFNKIYLHPAVSETIQSHK